MNKSNAAKERGREGGKLAVTQRKLPDTYLSPLARLGYTVTCSRSGAAVAVITSPALEGGVLWTKSRPVKLWARKASCSLLRVRSKGLPFSLTMINNNNTIRSALFGS